MQEPEEEEESSDSVENRFKQQAPTEVKYQPAIEGQKKRDPTKLAWVKASRIMKQRNKFNTPGPTKYAPKVVAE